MAPNNEVTTPQRMRVHVSDDRQQAWLQLEDIAHPKFTPPSGQDVLAVLQRAHIEITDAVKEKIDAYAKLVSSESGGEGRPEIPEKYLIAEGRKPVEGQHAKFKWHDRFQHDDSDRSEDERVNYFTLHSIITVDPDTAIGILHKGEDGKVGYTVLGEELRPKILRANQLELGDGLRVSEDNPDEIVTTTAGRVVIGKTKIRVEEILQIKGDIDFESGSIDSTVNVEVEGAVRANFDVKTTRSLTVRGTIEAATVMVKADVTSLKGIVGNPEKGFVHAGKTVTVRFANEATVEAGESVCIARSIMNSHIRTPGRMLIENGAIIGGETYARELVAARTLGSDAGVVTRVIVGIDPYALVRIHELESQMRDNEHIVEKIRTNVQPLMAMMKRLTAEQREKATELLCRADEIDMKIDDAEKERQALWDSGKTEDPARILVSKEIHPGVCVSIGTREFRFDYLVHGPVAIESRKIRDVTELVAVNQRTGSVTVLKSREIDLSRFEKRTKEPGADDGSDADAGKHDES